MKHSNTARMMGPLAALLLVCATLSSCTRRSAGGGQAAPAFTLPSVDGRQVSLSDYSGKVVVINFFAHW